MKVKKPTIDYIQVRTLALGSFSVENYLDIELTIPRAAALELYSEEWTKDPIEIDFHGPELTFIFPQWITEIKDAGAAWLDIHKKMEETYYKLIRLGVPRAEAEKCLDGFVAAKVNILISANKFLSDNAKTCFCKILGEEFYKKVLEEVTKGLQT